MIIDVFLDQKRLYVCEDTVKMVPHESYGELPPEQVQDRKVGGDEGKFEWKSSELNTRAVPRGQNELIGKFKIAMGDVIIVRG